MKIAVGLMLLTCSHTLVLAAKSEGDGKTEKRALVEGNAALKKRAPVIATASPSPVPGIVYADTKETLSDKSPTQQIYATPTPQVAKISDVLGGQGSTFPTAIEGHLYSPVSVYQPRLGSPTTYEVSAPIPSQLAYSEHKISYPSPQQNSIQYYNEPERHQPQLLKQSPVARVTVNYTPQQIPQQVTYLQQPLVYQQPQIIPAQQVQYNQPPQQINYRHPNYNQNRQPVAYIHHLQPGLAYADQTGPARYQTPNFIVTQSAQREVKADQANPIKFLEKSTFGNQNYNGKSQGAVSYASFSQSQPTPNYTPSSQNLVTPSYSPPNNKQEAPALPVNIQLPKAEASPPIAPINRSPVLTYFRPQIFHAIPQFPYPQQPQVYSQQPRVNPQQPEVYPQQRQLYSQQPQQLLIQNPGYVQQPFALAPTFPPVQYFGKFAPVIFGAYRQ